MRRAFAALPLSPAAALIDGNRSPILPCVEQTVVGGDGLSLSIAAASIIAKVTRDRLMRALALRPTPHHRRSFAPVQLILGFDSRKSA